MSDTIVALSSGGLPSGVAVVRCSGPQTAALVVSLAGKLPQPRRATLRTLRDSTGEVIDTGLVLWMPAPASFTGEDCAEFHIHGSRAVVSRMLQVATGQDGIRLAETGEFTRRSFANGRIDLTEAEGLSDLLLAETEAQRRYALLQSQGALRELYEGWRRDILDLRAMIEADIDFSDEDDVPDDVSDSVTQRLKQLRAAIASHLADGRRSKMIRDGFRVAIVGRPNAGKSTLLNHLSGSDVAIVSDEPGTTRDIVEVRIDLGGYLVLVSDTAGLRATDSHVEREGIRRALGRAAEADLVLHLDENGLFEPLPDIDPAKTIRVRSKIDMGSTSEGEIQDFGISVRSGVGFEPLISHIRTSVEAAIGGGEQEMLLARERHVECLSDAVAALDRALAPDIALEIKAEELRLASVALGTVTGVVGIEDVLGAIFSSFCIGK